MPKDRQVENVDRYFGNFTKLIAERIKKKGKVRILDAGCGYGLAMLGFVKRFGDKLEMVGYNYSKHDGNTQLLKKKAIEMGFFTKEELAKIKNFPKFSYHDASKKLPFKDNSFDFIYSMASIYLYDDKIAFLEDCSRILKKNGIARISPSFEKKDRKSGRPDYYWTFWEIWDKDKEVKIWNYANKIKGVKAIWKKRNQKGGNKPMYMEILGKKKVDFKLRFVSSIDYNFLWKGWSGVKSIYSTQLKEKFVPKWKRK